MTQETDKELLELAAKAAGLTWSKSKDITHDGLWIIKPSVQTYWNPLTDDGDALRLAVKLNLLSDPRFIHERDVLMFTQGIEKLEATRRAIVRAAAEIGRAM
jgi:hypothetical protein